VRIRFTPTARAQFLSALSYIQQDNPTAARRIRKKVETSLRRLLEYPDSGRTIPEFPELPQRELVVTPYRLFYRVTGKTIWVVGFWHGAQLPKPPAIDEGG
jgi:plasmid stabilization system protein ParE